MSPNQLFSVVNAIALCIWVLLAVFPRRRWVTEVLVILIPALFAAGYTAIIISTFGNATGGFSSLPEVALLFSNQWLLLAGWIHYLAFDLLVGACEVRDSQRRAIPHLLVVPCLILTFLFGPAGWLLYLGVRLVRENR